MEEANLNYINELSGDSLEFRAKLIAIIKKELPEEIATYYVCKKNINLRLMAESVHKLKHKISLLGLEKSYYIAEKFEENLKNNSTNLQSDFECILKIMQEFVTLL
jgi:predicted DNA binding CopG/RHH family protein